MKKEIMWAIIGKHGLYAGTALTRKEMIKRHCWHFYGNWPNFPGVWTIKRIWKQKRKEGDRAIKVEICPIT